MREARLDGEVEGEFLRFYRYFYLPTALYYWNIPLSADDFLSHTRSHRADSPALKIL